MNLQDIIGELQGIFADAEAGRDLPNIEHRLSIVATKVDALAEAPDASLSGSGLRFLTTTLDTIRRSIGSDPQRAYYNIKALCELLRDNLDAAEQTIAERDVHEFLSNDGAAER